MIKGIKTITLAAMMALLVILPVQANEGVYVRALGSIAQLSDSDLDSSELGSGKAEFDPGFSGGAGLGYDFGAWRLEAEIMYRSNDLDSVAGTAFDGVDEGDFASLGIGINALYEFNLFRNPHITSYAGAGLVWFQEIDLDFEGPAGELSYSGDDTAVQLMAGARYDLQNRFSIHVELRQLIASSISLSGEGVAVGSFDADYDRTEIVVGLGYRF